MSDIKLVSAEERGGSRIYCTRCSASDTLHSKAVEIPAGVLAGRMYLCFGCASAVGAAIGMIFEEDYRDE